MGGMKKTTKPSQDPQEPITDSIADELAAVDISDEVLEADDKKKAAAKKKAKKEAKKHRSAEDRKRSARKKMIIAASIAIFIIVASLVIPQTRWPILNTIGFRGDLTIIAVGQDGQQPIAGVAVALENTEPVITDSYGRALFRQIRLGNQHVTVQKSGYGQVQHTVTNKVGSTQHVMQMKVIGLKLDFDVRHWLSGKKIEGAKITYKESAATTDKSGVASLIIPPTDEKEIEAEVSAEGYLTKRVKTELAVASREVSLVAAQKNYFISKRDGKFDIFSSNLDGNDQKKIIEATGKEEENFLQFTIHRNNQQAILVANREGRVANARIIAGIYAIDLEKATLQKIDEGSEVQLLDWSGDSIVYTKSQLGLNYDDPNLTKLITFHIGTRRLTEIAQTNYFALSFVANDKVFFMPSDPYRPIENAVLTSQHLQTGARATYLEGKLLNYGVRSSFATLDVQDNTGATFEINTATGVVRPIDRKPNTSFQFAISANGAQAVWTDRRDGQGTLLLQPVAGGGEKTIAASPGLTAPLRFISDDLVVVRSATSEETADYVISISTGKIAKIVDVSHVGMLRRIGL